MDVSAKASVNKKTFENYEWMVKKHLLPTLGVKKLKSLSPLQIQDLYQRKPEAGLSRRTVQLIHVVSRMALKQAVSFRQAEGRQGQECEPLENSRGGVERTW